VLGWLCFVNEVNASWPKFTKAKMAARAKTALKAVANVKLVSLNEF